MQLPVFLLFGLFSTAIAGSLKDLEIDVTKRIAVEECTIKASSGDTVKVHYTGRLMSNNKTFDSSYSRNSPIEFKLGVGQVIPGWDQGVIGMCVGEERTLNIPASLAYGKNGIPGVIPGDSDLQFDVKLVDATHK